MQSTSATSTTHGGVATIRKVQPGSSESGKTLRMQLEGGVEASIGVAKGDGIGGTAMGEMHMAMDRPAVDGAKDAKVAERRNPEFQK